ncbi:MAG TPA: alpha/beta hydrolase [Allosphingosinicella sp.]
MHMIRTGEGPKLLLVHGLGSSAASWAPIAPALAQGRELIAIDLPGHGETPAEGDSGTFTGLARSLEAFLDEQGLTGVDAVGLSLGGRLVLEMARRGRVGAIVALDPGGFWEGWERSYLRVTLGASVWLVRRLGAALPALAAAPPSRAMLLAQFSNRPWDVPAGEAARELGTIAATPTFDALLDDLAFGPVQAGPAAAGAGPVTIGWGRDDRLCLPVQALRAQEAFPSAQLHWFDDCGHFAIWDKPRQVIELIRNSTG